MHNAIKFYTRVAGWLLLMHLVRTTRGLGVRLYDIFVLYCIFLIDIKESRDIMCRQTFRFHFIKNLT